MPSTLMVVSNPHRPDPRVLTESRALVREGFEVTVIAWNRDGKTPVDREEEGARVVRIGPRCPQRAPTKVLSRLARFWCSALAASKRLDFDIVHSHDLDTLPAGLLISRLRGKPLLYDAHELYAKMIKDDVGPAWRLVWFLERILTRTADKIITVSDSLADELPAARGGKASVVSTSQDPSVVDGASREELKERYGLHGFVVSYLGSLEPGRFVEELVSAFQPGEKVTVLVGGHGTLQPLVQRTALQNSAVKFIGEVPADEALRLTWASDLVVAMMDPRNPNNVVGTPGKIINAMAVGRPLVTTEGLNIGRAVAEAGCGLVIPYDRQVLRETVLGVMADQGRLKDMGERGLAFYSQHYSWESSKSELLKVYKTLAGNGLRESLYTQ